MLGKGRETKAWAQKNDGVIEIRQSDTHKRWMLFHGWGCIVTSISLSADRPHRYEVLDFIPAAGLQEEAQPVMVSNANRIRRPMIQQPMKLKGQAYGGAGICAP